MSVPLQKLFTADCMEVRFPGYYSQKDFMRDVSRLRALVGMRDHGPKIPYSGDGKDFIPTVGKSTPSEAELVEVDEIRKRLRRAPTDVAMLLVITTMSQGGWRFF